MKAMCVISKALLDIGGFYDYDGYEAYIMGVQVTGTRPIRGSTFIQKVFSDSIDAYPNKGAKTEGNTQFWYERE